MIRDSLQKKIMKRIFDDAVINLRLLNSDQFEIGESYFNYKCHINAVNHVKLKKAEKVILCLCLDNQGQVIVHFINQLKNGKYVDNTLGYFGNQEYSYYMIKEVDPEEFINVNEILRRTQEHYVDKHSNFITKRLSKVGI